MLLLTSRISVQMPMIRVKSIGQQNMVIRECQQKNIKKEGTLVSSFLVIRAGFKPATF